MAMNLAQSEDLRSTIEELRTEREALKQELKYLRRQQELVRLNRSNLLEIQRVAGIADIMVYEVSAMSGRLHCPNATAVVFGVPERGATLGDLFQIIHPDDRERFERGYADAVNDGTPRKITHCMTLPDGTTRIVNHYIKTFLASNGMPLKTVGLLQDITERKQMEAELKDAMHQSEQATKAKSAFLATMSHEIRTPLNGVLGFARLIQRTELTRLQEDYVDNIVISSSTLLDLINDILDLAKIEAGKMDIERTNFDLDQLLVELSALFHNLVGDKAIDLRLHKEPEIPSVLVGDPLRVRQILTNLIGNAVKFTDRGHVAVAVEMQAMSEREVTLRFFVRDTGIGIPPDKLNGLFDSFIQGDDSTTRKYGGTGLGLAICRHLTTLMNGQIGVDSALGQGTTFWVELSFQRPLAAQLSQRAVPTDREVSVDRLVGIRVLLVEDNAINRKMAEYLLRAEGIGVDHAHNGVEALSKVSERVHDIVLMDMEMPEMDGYEATRRLRQDERFAALPIIAMTAHAMAGDREKCLSAGADDYISKPIDATRLLEILSRWTRAAQERTSDT